MIDRYPQNVSAACAFAALATMNTTAAFGVELVPIEQERNVSTFVIVPPCMGDDFDGAEAPAFDPFDASVTSTVSCDSAGATAFAEQTSSIHSSALEASGSAWSEAHGPVPSTIHSIASSAYSVTFAVSERCRYALDATLSAGSDGTPTLSGGSVQLSEQGLNDIVAQTLQPPPDGGEVSHHVVAAGILEPGIYIFRASASSVIDQQVPPSSMGQAAYAIEFTLTKPGDIDADGAVDLEDLLELLVHWGPCPPPCPADVDGDGTVGIQDLLLLLIHWG